MIKKNKTSDLWLGVLLSSISITYVRATAIYNDLTLKQAIKMSLSRNSKKNHFPQAAATVENQRPKALSARWPTLTQQDNLFMSWHDTLLKLAEAYCVPVTEVQ